MSILRNSRYRGIFAGVVALAWGLGGMVSAADAQTSTPRVATRSNTSAASASQDSEMANEQLRERVAAALHSSPIDDGHIQVSTENGVVTLHGFVLNEWDFNDALLAARKAAGDSPVVDALSIKLGGR
jgi:osmotically-inducible protein OsmY